MRETTKKNFRLYALPIREGTVEIVSEARFGRMTSEYALIYTDVDAPSGAICLENRDAERLTENDRQWLWDCNLVITAEEMKKNEQEICGDISDQLYALEQRLHEEAEKLKEKESAIRNGTA